MDLYISTQGTSISRRKNTFLIVTEEESSILSPEKIETIILESNSSISTGAIKLAIEYDISIVISDTYGNLLGHFYALNYSKGGKLRKKQYEFFVSERGIYLARKWIIEKINNQKKQLETLLKRRKKTFEDAILFDEAIRKIEILKINAKNFREKLMGIEGSISKIYYKSISETLPDKWKFNTREHRNAKKPYNIVLNYILGILYRIIEVAIVKEGFDPAMGIIHVEGENKNSFVYDFIEKYRYLALETSFNLFNEKIIEKDFFEYDEDKMSILTITARRTISFYFKDLLNKGKKVGGKFYSIETLIKSDLKDLKKEILEIEEKNNKEE